MLTPRLATIAQYVPWGARVIDVGCDHAYLAIHLAKENIASYVVASDVVPGPLAVANSNIRMAGLKDKIKTTLAYGLDAIESNEINCAIIAGMGAVNITDILDKGADKLAMPATLILQPMIAVHKLRYWLAANAWQIITERLVREDERIYEIIVAHKAEKPYTLTQQQAYVGNIYNQEDTKEYLCQALEHNMQLLDKVNKAKAQTEQVIAKKEHLTTLINIFKEAINASR